MPLPLQDITWLRVWIAVRMNACGAKPEDAEDQAEEDDKHCVTAKHRLRCSPGLEQQHLSLDSLLASALCLVALGF